MFSNQILFYKIRTLQVICNGDIKIFSLLLIINDKIENKCVLILFQIITMQNVIRESPDSNGYHLN